MNSGAVARPHPSATFISSAVIINHYLDIGEAFLRAA
jgi:hypothetical protein